MRSYFPFSHCCWCQKRGESEQSPLLFCLVWKIPKNVAFSKAFWLFFMERENWIVYTKDDCERIPNFVWHLVTIFLRARGQERHYFPRNKAHWSIKTRECIILFSIMTCPCMLSRIFDDKPQTSNKSNAQLDFYFALHYQPKVYVHHVSSLAGKFSIKKAKLVIETKAKSRENSQSFQALRAKDIFLGGVEKVWTMCLFWWFFMSMSKVYLLFLENEVFTNCHFIRASRNFCPFLNMFPLLTFAISLLAILIWI